MTATTDPAAQDMSWLVAIFDAVEAAPPAPVEAPAPAAPAPIIATTRRTCIRCGGEGRIPGMQHVKGGVCFRCNGQGTTLK